MTADTLIGLKVLNSASVRESMGMKSIRMSAPKTGSIHLPFLISSECLEMAVIKNHSQQDWIRTRAKDMTSECGSAASVL